jgi:hypothetical protein
LRINTFERNYMSRLDLCDAVSALKNLPGACEHFSAIRIYVGKLSVT